MGKRDFSTNPNMEDLRRNWIHTFSICSSFFFFLALPRVVWDLNSPNRDQTVAPALEAQGLNHWATEEVPRLLFLRLSSVLDVHG